ncbi:unnamed protein product [Discosporangium mesarthrocarpum]
MALDWVMGDDLILEVTGDESIVEIQEMIKSIKGVPVTRMSIWKGENASGPMSDKHMTWSLSRNGLYHEALIEVRPTRPNQWLWHPLEWYEERVLKDVEDIAQEEKWKGSCPLVELQAAVPMPPPLRRQSLRGLLRKHPERLRLEMDVVSQRFYVIPNEGKFLLPSSY